MTDDADALPPLDGKRLVAAIQSGDQRVIEEAYRRTFHTDLGRIVMLHHLTSCGVGNPLRAETDSELRELVGRHNAALELADRAGFGQASVALEIMSGHFEESQDEETRAVPAYIPGDNDPLDF